jgi:hypothetical protein
MGTKQRALAAVAGSIQRLHGKPGGEIRPKQ